MIYFHLVVDCDVLSDPENGQVTFLSTVYQSQAVYSCNSGFELSQTGSVQRICRANGLWSSFAPQCNRKLKMLSFRNIEKAKGYTLCNIIFNPEIPVSR